MKITNDFLTANPAQSGIGGNTSLANSAANATMSNFASLLQQSRAPAAGVMARDQAMTATAAEKSANATPAAADKSASAASADSADSSQNTEATDEAEQNEAATKPRAPAKTRTRTNDDANPRATRERSGVDRKTETQASDASAAKASDDDKKSQNDTAMPTWITGWAPTAPSTPVGLRNPSPADASDAGGTSDAATGTDILDTGSATAQSGKGRGLPNLGAKKADARDTFERAGTDAVKAGDTAATAAKDAGASQGFGSILDDLRGAQAARREEVANARSETRIEARMEGRVDATHAGAALNGASATSASSTTQDASSTASTQMQAAVGSPEFPQELGVKLSLLAKDGVQKAELHLNPAEMGPVSVQIVMDGTQARIDFGADVAATRQAIEAGLPELASALRDAGFTLAGGGVSQHAGGRQGSDSDGSQRESGARRIGVTNGAAGQSGEPAARVVRTRVSPGGVDLYA